jgi:hypothetical protein
LPVEPVKINQSKFLPGGWDAGRLESLERLILFDFLFFGIAGFLALSLPSF